MWDKIKKMLGYAWASPVTFAGLTYAGIFTIAKWYDWVGVREDGLVFHVKSDAPSWLRKLWTGWGGHAVGNVVVLNVDPEEKPVVLKHELVHVRQCMRLGIFQPVIYAASWIGIKFGCEASDPYLDCPFEIDARRAAGQTVDMTSQLRKKE